MLSASLFGMAVDSTALAPISDRIRHRPMALTTACATVGMLILRRAATGLRISGLMDNLNALIAEHSSNTRRSAVVAIYAAGNPLGATIAGLISRPLSRSSNGAPSSWPEPPWPSSDSSRHCSVYESLDYLITHQPKNAPDKLKVLFGKMGRLPVNALRHISTPDISTQSADKPADHNPVREAFTPSTLRYTLALWIDYTLLTASCYVANTWIPTILTRVSGDPRLGSTMGIWASFGSIIGCFLFADIALKIHDRLLLAITIFVAAGTFVLLSLVFFQVRVTIAIGLLLAMSTTVGIAGFCTIATAVYPGCAWATGTAQERVFTTFAVPLVISCLAVLVMVFGRHKTLS